MDAIARLRIDPNGPREPAAVAIIAASREPGDPDSRLGERGATILSDGQGGDGGRGAGKEVQRTAPPLAFEVVLESVEEQFPLILAALEEIEIAEGQLLAAQGGFDLRAKADAQLGIQGFYENEFGKAVLVQPTTVLGAQVFAGYKFGTGDFPIWEGGLKTNEDGEFGGGVILPLLAGRDIDKRRLALWRARVERSQADPKILFKRLEASRKAALSYWKWVATGQKLNIGERLLAFAEERQVFVTTNVANGELPEIAVDENQRLVVARQATVVDLRRALSQAAIELSLYLRDAEGRPRLPREDELPDELPVPRDPSVLIAPDDRERALLLRPEVQQLQLEVEKIELEIDQARNTLLPKLDLGVAATQDIGDAVSSPDDKGPFEFDVLLDFDLPLQRRAARGKVRSLEAKKRKVERQLQFARERITADVRRFEVELVQNYAQLGLTREDARFAGILEQAERNRFEIGESDLLRVTIREQVTAAAAGKLVDAIALHFLALAEYRASLGVAYDEVRSAP